MTKKKSFILRITSVMMTAILTCSIAGCSSSAQKSTSALNPEKPVTITIWNYYNGDQLAAFEQLIEEFNESVGTEKGIVAISVSQGDISTLANSLLDSVEGKAGAQDIPTLAAVYSETAYILNEQDALAPLDPYFTEDELSAYVPGFLEEGRFTADNELMQFPILKSTEIFTANKTDWEPFAKETGITLESVQTNEGLTAAAEAYYEWTDAQTPDVPEDGKSLYGRDSVGNYIYLGSCQLGHELFPFEDGDTLIDLDRDTFKTLWDNYYIPYINGYFGNYAKFSSEDAKIGKILALTSSSSGVTYLPDAVTQEDDTTHSIEIYATKALPFENAVSDAVVQQGASYCLLKSTDAQQEGAAEFLKWSTESERNLAFATMSGYSAVTLEANTEKAIKDSYTSDVNSAKGKLMLDSLLLSADAFNNNTAYATKPFDGSRDVRSLLESSLQDTAKADRATVLASIASGSSRAEAVAEFSTDEYFDQWFDTLCDNVNTIVQK